MKPLSSKAAPQVVVPPRKGLMHVVDAGAYSLAGLRRLWQETAARLECAGAGLVVIAFLLRGVSLWHWVVAGGLLALILSVEALNTAIEVLTDRVSPEWSEMAKDAKDLGSFSVGVMLMATALFVALTLVGAI